MESILPTARKSQKNSVPHRFMEDCSIFRIPICTVQTVTAVTVTRTDAPARRRMLYLQLITRIYKAVYFARIRLPQLQSDLIKINIVRDFYDLINIKQQTSVYSIEYTMPAVCFLQNLYDHKFYWIILPVSGARYRCCTVRQFCQKRRIRLLQC